MIELANDIQNCQKCELCNLGINKIKPFDKDRLNKKIVFVAQNPSIKREISDKIFEYNNTSDIVMNLFLTKLNLTRDNVYFTNIVKCSTLDNEFPNENSINQCIELFYKEIDLIKPLIIVCISKLAYNNIDKNKIKCPIIYLNHPSYYYYKTNDYNKSSETMYDVFKSKIINNNLYYNMLIDFIDKNIYFKDESIMINFFSEINDIRIAHITIDNNNYNIIIFKGYKNNYISQFIYYNYCYVECDENEYEKKTLDGIYCKKFYYQNPFELNKYNKIYEKDIHSNNRFIIDYYDYFNAIEKEKLNYMTFDIETNKSVDVVNTSREIISIVYLLNGKYEFLFLNNNNNNFEMLKDKEDIKIFYDEISMLSYFINVFRNCNVITGFNINGFDIIYLLNRAKLLGIDYNKFSPINRVYNNVIKEEDRMDSRNIKIYGIDIVDTMAFCKDKFFVYSLDKPSQMNLDYLGEFLNLGKKVEDSRGPSTLWQEDPEKLYVYNIQDTKLCRDIDDYVGLINYILSFKNLMSTFNLNLGLYNSKIIDFFILCNYSDKYVFPSKSDNPKEELIGGYVKEPVSDVYKNVGVLDFNSLYPNIIRNFNISYETLSLNKDKFEDYINIDNKYFINKTKEGLLNEIVNKLIVMKVNMFNEMQNSDDKTLYIKYNAIKSVINGLYGVFAYRWFRLYNINVASCITTIARSLTKRVVNYIDNNKETLAIGADTDSCFVHLKLNLENFDDVKKYFDELVINVNNDITKYIEEEYGIINKYINIECETIFYKLLQTQAKKKYFGLGYYIKNKSYKELKEYGRGIDLVKKDTPLALRPILKELLINIVLSNDISDIKKYIEIIRDKINKLNYKDLLITKQISREINEYKVLPIHVRAMKWSNEHIGTDFSRANYKGGMLYCKGKNIDIKTDVVMLNNDIPLPSYIDIDYDRYFDIFIKNKVSLFNDKFKILFNNNELLSKFF